MNFDFSDDQKHIQDQARSFLQGESPVETVRKVLDNNTGHDADLWTKIVEMGWTATVIPEDKGGLGLSYLELCVIAEEMGRSLAPVPFAASVYLATTAILEGASEANQAAWLPKLAAGEWVGTLASRSRELPQAGDNGLTGVITATQGLAATHCAVLAQHKGADVLVWVDLAAEGVSVKALESVDPTQPLAQISFDNTPFTAFDGADAHSVINRVHDTAAVLLAFEQVGGCEAALEMGMEYTKGRYAFGRQVATFQAIKHKFADMFVAKELAKSNAWYGAWALSADAPELPLAAATARTTGIEAYWECSKENLQAHGGMGFTWEFDCHLYYRRAQAISLMIGGKTLWQEKLVDRLLAA